MPEIIEYIKPRAFGEPIHPDSPDFNPQVHKDLVTEINEFLTSQFQPLQDEVILLRQEVNQLKISSGGTG